MYNPAVLATVVNRILVLLGAVGLFITTSLTYAHFSNTLVPCGAGNACEALWAQKESKLFGVSVAVYGLFGYAVLFALAGVRALAWDRFGKFATKAGLLVSSVGFVFTIYLVSTLIFKLHTSCQWCFGSAITMTLTFIGHLLLLKSVPKEGDPSMFDALLVPFSLVGSVGVALMMLADQPKFSPSESVKADVLVYEQLIPSPTYLDGASTGRVTLVEIADFYCGACRGMSKIIRSVKDSYGPNLNLAYRNFPIYNAPGHENSLAASLAAEYARSKGKYWDFIHAMFSDGAEEAVRSDITLAELLDRLQLDGAEWKKSYQSTKSPMFNDLDQGMKLFELAGIHTTPTFVIYIDKKDPVVVPGERLAAVLQASPYRELLEGKRP